MIGIGVKFLVILILLWNLLKIILSILGIGIGFLVILILLWNLLKAHSEYNWDWFVLSYNSNVTLEFIETHPEVSLGLGRNFI